MPTKLNPYFSFKGQAREAMEFYKTVFGGTLTLNTFKEAGAPVDADQADEIMHAMLVADNGITLMASDTPHQVPVTPGSSISVSLSGDNEAELRGYWDKLSASGTVAMPLEKAPWGDTFGMLQDKYGIQWMVNIAGKK
jgi:PhnB protein